MYSFMVYNKDTSIIILVPFYVNDISNASKINVIFFAFLIL